MENTYDKFNAWYANAPKKAPPEFQDDDSSYNPEEENDGISFDSVDEDGNPVVSEDDDKDEVSDAAEETAASEDQTAEDIVSEIENDESLSSSSPEEDEGHEDDVFDPQDEALSYSSSSQSAITFEELIEHDGTDEEEEKEDQWKSPEKKSFDEVVSSGKSVNASGKMNKGMILAAIGAFFVILLLVFSLFTSSKSAGKKHHSAVSGIAVNDGYTPDFGDYKSRSHRQTQAEKNTEDANYAQELLTGGNRNEYVPEQKIPEYSPENYKSSVPVQKTEAPYSASPSYSGPSRWETAMKSPLRLSSSGFGSPNRASSVPSYQEYQGSIIPGIPGMAGTDAVSGYMNELQGIQNALGVPSQSSQQDRINVGRYSENGRYDPSVSGGDIQMIPENSIIPGTVLHAVLISGINTDYPGPITARIIEPVYDSRTGKKLLIPQGSVLRGSYSSSSIGIAKVQIAWTTLIINRDGKNYMVNLGSMAGIDRAGYSGIGGSLNDHYFQYLKAAGISCLFTFLNSNIYAYSNAQTSATRQQMISDSQEIGNKLADRILDRALDIQPTVTVKSRTPVSVDVDKILTLVPVENDIPVKRYVRK